MGFITFVRTRLPRNASTAPAGCILPNWAVRPADSVALCRDLREFHGSILRARPPAEPQYLVDPCAAASTANTRHLSTLVDQHIGSRTVVVLAPIFRLIM